MVGAVPYTQSRIASWDDPMRLEVFESQLLGAAAAWVRILKKKGEYPDNLEDLTEQFLAAFSPAVSADPLDRLYKRVQCVSEDFNNYKKITKCSKFNNNK